jgi:hypothetical protein
VLLQRLQLSFELLGYFVDLAPNKAEVRVFVAHEAEDEVENGSSHVALRIVLQNQILECVVEKSLLPERSVLMAYLGKYGRKRVAIVFLICFCNHTSLKVGEKSKSSQNKGAAYRTDLMWGDRP